ncbi:glycosyltransferase family 4 protein [Solirubrobacter sp. CPCC 204708]|uniref:Glycosyltransferase family 4 protein n=1 Tax=Solirubrobacter deserti TaxID=2282478 RepID=A0ABT4RM57_9ACTN|nr:glycosyltransferase family 4 protein [Solirubrobacter deserti]MBE2317979.1 glycosyltransferase family 4 protein [Solirubrobacter deserti]MDA0139658.1 glycosyltransferase family 4 protein [Solirubrobacter deserti]
MPEFGFVTEYTVGHVTFERLLREAAAADPTVAASWFAMTYPPRGLVERRLPGLRSNWSLRASFRARRLLAMHRRPWDALLFHTQTASLFSRDVMRRVPTVISLDATPVNLDEVAVGYDHAVGGRRVEAAKRAVVAGALRSAAGLVAWSEWVRASLIDDYGVDPAVIRLIPAGTSVPAAPPVREARERPRVLFVGGNFARKGGETLLRAVDGLDVDVHIVTQSQVAPRAGVTVHNDVRPGSAVLHELYADCDLFVLPTAADASPHVVLEAMAVGLPVVSTRVGAIPEMVADGETGLLTAPNDTDAVRAAIERLLDPALRARLGRAGHARAAERFDAARNARGVLDVMADVSRAR